MRQRNLRVVEVESFDSLKKIIESKYFELVKGNYFLLDAPNKEIEEYLKEKGLSYIIKNSTLNDVKVVERVVEKVVQKEVVKEVKSDKKSVVYDRIIRSGEEIISDDNLVFLQRINAGAKIVCNGSVTLLDECEGSVVCEGEYILLRKNPKGTIIFKGEEIKDIEGLTFISKNSKKVFK